MSKLFKMISKLFFTAFFIYSYNLLAQSLNLIIPLNLLTIIYVYIFGVPGLISLISILLFVFKV